MESFPNSVNYFINSLKNGSNTIKNVMICHKLPCLPNPTFSVSSTAEYCF